MAAKKIRSFRDVWSFPLNYDGLGKTWSLVDEMAFDFENENTAIREAFKYVLVDCLNDEFVDSPLDKNTVLIYSEGDIFLNSVDDKNRLLSIRGWGHMTGIGGLQLTAKRAADLQEEFAQFIIKRLTHDNT